MIELILPRHCPCCGQTLLPDEGDVCLSCLGRLPRVRAELPGNEVEYHLLGRFPLEHATSFCYYIRNDGFGNVIRLSKFGDEPWHNTYVTRLFVQELDLAAKESGVPGWPYDIDVIVPIPVHWLRLLSRGYNQTVAIAEALSEAWHLPICTGCLRKAHYTATQVGLSGSERLHHESGTFSVRHPERLASRHVLLVDDVLTTGATIVAAADALLAAVPDVRISVLTLSFAKS